jgi:hypothetical protein
MTADRAVSCSRFRYSPACAGVLMLATFPLMAGCGHQGGPPRAAVRGEVRVQDAPLKTGVIRFIPAGQGKGPVALTTIKEGRYEFTTSDGPVLGANSIEIVPGLAENPLAGARDIKAAWTEYAKTVAANTPAGAVPKRPTRNAEWKVDVKAKGQNTFDFKLASQ